MRSEPFRLEFQVRDYECDMQGVVNNAVYQNYLEHARHEFIRSLGLDFAELTRRHINLVVVRAELDYLSPLSSGQRIEVATSLERTSTLRFAFLQTIYLLPDCRVILKARMTGTVLDDRGRPRLPHEIEQILGAAAEKT